jgi:hypothetical protein
VVKKSNMLKSRKAPMRFVSLASLLLLLGGMASAACGVSDAGGKGKTSKGGTGSGGEGPTGATSGKGGNAGTGNVGNAAGSGDTSPGGQPAEVVPCKEGRGRCDGNTPQTCNADGVWENGKACGGTTKVCTGEGVCAAYRLVNAGIDSFGVRPAEGKIILKEQTLTAAPRSCNAKGLCVTGGIR